MMTVIAMMLAMAMVIVALSSIVRLSLVAGRASWPRLSLRGALPQQWLAERRPAFGDISGGWGGDSLWIVCLFFVQQSCFWALSHADKSDTSPTMKTIVGLATPSSTM
eukprot:8681702-Pyramimonas_sp.AAC.1